jgi:serine/threonine protein kinase
MANAPSTSAVRDQARPKKLGRYELEECLGTAGSVDTFRARVRGLAGFDRIFAVKCLRRRRGPVTNLSDPFVNTARRTAGVLDARVARVLDADILDGAVIAVTEFVHGLDLERFRECAHFAGVLATGSDEVGEKWRKIVAYVGSEIAGGLAAIHAQSPPLVHGGLTPRNVIATARGGIKLLDIGLGWAAHQLGDPISMRAANYMAPELANAEPSPESDMRSLGALLFELATGELPPPGGSGEAARKVLDALWPSMADCIAGLLADEPAQRPSAMQAAQALAEYWSAIPDASMVAEMTSLVRNLSAFAADADPVNTPPLVPEEPGLPTVPKQEYADLPRPVSSPRGPSEEPSFEALPEPVGASPDAAGHVESPPEPPPAEKIEVAPSPRRSPTIVAFPAIGMLVPALPRASEPPPPPPIPAAGWVATTVVDSEPIPELEEWGARALAALGDQAGVSIAPITKPTTNAEVLPPTVDDPTIAEAFALMPLPPAAEAPPAPLLSPLAPEAEAEDVWVQSLPGATEAETLLESELENELVDEQDEFVGVHVGARAGEAANVAEAPALRLDGQGAEIVSRAPAGVGDEDDAELEATAFEGEEGAGSETNSAIMRRARAMPAPAGDSARIAATRTARKSGSAAAPRASIETNGAESFRGKRVLLTLGIFVGAGGLVAALTAASGFFHGQDASALLRMPAPTSTKAASPAVVEEAPAVVAESATPAKTAGVAAAVAVEKPRLAESPPLAQKPASAAAKAASSVRESTTDSSVQSLGIASTPEGAMVWVGGEERGKTPCTVKLKAGPARVVLVHAGYLASQVNVEVREGAKVDETLKPVEPPMTGEARFRAECQTLSKLPIVVDGKETGIVCPFSKMRVDPGRHSIGVLVPATGKVHQKEITLRAGVRSVVFED